jgi:hypothetical protein
VVGGIWSVFSSVAHLPPALMGAGAGAISAIGIAQAVKAAAEERRERRRKKDDED